MSVERLDYLEVLAAICVRKGWALLLHLEVGPGGSANPRSYPTCLDVIAPALAAGRGRGEQLKLGTVVATSPVGSPARLQQAAEACVQALAPIIEAEAA